MDFLKELEKGILTKSPEETHEVAKRLASILPEDCTVAFHGDLGVGKTTFIQGMAHAWEINEPITSPTFNLFIIHKGKRNLVHLDAYRLESEEDLESLLIDEFLESPYCLVVEWPSKIKDYIPEDAWHIHLETISGSPTHRVITKKKA